MKNAQVCIREDNEVEEWTLQYLDNGPDFNNDPRCAEGALILQLRDLANEI